MTVKWIFSLAITNKIAGKQDGAHFVLYPKQGNKIEGAVLD